MLINEFNLSSKKVLTVYNPISINEIVTLSEKSVEDLPDDYILYVGRLSVVKNLSLLLTAFKLFNELYPDVKLLVIGDGQAKSEIETMISELKMGKAVCMLGIKPNPFPYIKNAKIVVLSSQSEALPTILLESLALGKTVVSTPTLGAVDILNHGEYGYLSKSLTDVESYFDALKSAYKNPIDRDILCQAVINYDLEIKIDEVEALWMGDA